MKTLFQTIIKMPLMVLLLLIIPAATAKAQDSRINLSGLDHLASKASQTVDVNIDERLLRMAAKLFSPDDIEEREVKKLVEGLKGIYVKRFEFETDGQYAGADVESIRVQVRGPGWTRLASVISKKEGSLEVYLKMEGELINGLAVLHTDDRELTIVNIVGPVDINKLAKLEGQLGIPELGIETTKPKTKNDEK